MNKIIVKKLIYICILFYCFKNSVQIPSLEKDKVEPATLSYIDVTSNTTDVNSLDGNKESTNKTNNTGSHNGSSNPSEVSISASTASPSFVTTASTPVPPSTNAQNSTSTPNQTYSDDSLAAVHKAALEQMNIYRVKHKVPPLRISSKLNKQCQDWATIVTSEGKIRHSCIGDCDYGENAAREPPSKNLSAAFVHAITVWYDEWKLYDFTKGQSIGGAVTGHFTQIVWKASTEVGFGLAGPTTTDKLMYIFAQFQPAGNFEDEYIDNVFPE